MFVTTPWNPRKNTVPSTASQRTSFTAPRHCHPAVVKRDVVIDTAALALARVFAGCESAASSLLPSLGQALQLAFEADSTAAYDLGASPFDSPPPAAAPSSHHHHSALDPLTLVSPPIRWDCLEVVNTGGVALLDLFLTDPSHRFQQATAAAVKLWILAECCSLSHVASLLHEASAEASQLLPLADAVAALAHALSEAGGGHLRRGMQPHLQRWLSVRPIVVVTAHVSVSSYPSRLPAWVLQHMEHLRRRPSHLPSSGRCTVPSSLICLTATVAAALAPHEVAPTPGTLPLCVALSDVRFSAADSQRVGAGRLDSAALCVLDNLTDDEKRVASVVGSSVALIALVGELPTSQPFPLACLAQGASASSGVVLYALCVECSLPHAVQALQIANGDMFQLYGTESSAFSEAIALWCGVAESWNTAPQVSRGWWHPKMGLEGPLVWTLAMLSSSLVGGSFHLTFQLPHRAYASELHTIMCLLAGEAAMSRSSDHSIRILKKGSAHDSTGSLLPCITQEKQQKSNPAVPVLHVLRAGEIDGSGKSMYIDDVSATPALALRALARFQHESRVTVAGGGAMSSASIEVPVAFSTVAVAVASRRAAPAAAEFIDSCDLVMKVSDVGASYKEAVGWALDNFDVSGTLGETAADRNASPSWIKYERLLRADIRGIITVPQVGVAATHLLESYFRGVMGAFSEALGGSRLMQLLVKLTTAHAALRMLWTVPMHLFDAVFSAGVEACSIDALVAIALVDRHLAVRLESPMLELGTMLTDSATRDSQKSKQPSHVRIDDGVAASYFRVIIQQIVACGSG